MMLQTIDIEDRKYFIKFNNEISKSVKLVNKLDKYEEKPIQQFELYGLTDDISIKYYMPSHLTELFCRYVSNLYLLGDYFIELNKLIKIFTNPMGRKGVFTINYEALSITINIRQCYYEIYKLTYLLDFPYDINNLIACLIVERINKHEILCNTSILNYIPQYEVEYR